MRRMVGITSTVLMTVSTTPFPMQPEGLKTVHPKVPTPHVSPPRQDRIEDVLRNRRIQLSRLSGPKDPAGVVYSLANNRIVRVQQIGFPSLVTGHRPRTSGNSTSRHTQIGHADGSTAALKRITSRGQPLLTVVQVGINAGAAATSEGSQLAKLGLHLVGCSYLWGGTSPSGFDCSGLTQYVYSRLHISIPRTSYQQFSCGRPVSRSELLPGDLVFFRTDGAGASHVALYIGNNLIVQSLNRQTGVIVSHLTDPYYESTYLGARRPW